MPSGGSGGGLVLPILPSWEGDPAPPSAPPPPLPGPAPGLTMRTGLDTDRRGGILGPMLKHQAFLFTYGNRPTGCHGRAA
ncbi:hypothetical protein RGQ21_31560 [Kitasatospora aureofaciens]|nr:hypothetical protein RGQ21_31560 [Kitasatospora aureofaciens]